ncbi:PfkB family carbohydrate kinase [Streptomyces camelliae]|uniref:PfkB family carbohydrate kinase n=1 Tax=Streptomyces camelliae TaxID=3004093 RepID=A0ABY7NYX3_9ACTN|nr:PfkB family carbohydrate kinase [Streptomyces sp. HUAS 2-6]WBO63429.1 PfkB family carbohydrate kinase [Streptomyces sp. HUAS 2-6]
MRVVVTGTDFVGRRLRAPAPSATANGANVAFGLGQLGVAARRAGAVGINPLLRDQGGADLVVIAPDDPWAMLGHARECRRLAVPFTADPGSGVTHTGTEEARALVRGAHWLFTGAHERELLLAATGWRTQEVLRHVGAWVTTLGARGARVESHHFAEIRVPACEVRRVVDPRGAGDAFRAGFVAGVVSALTIERAAQLGCVTAGFALESPGAQGYAVPLRALPTCCASTPGTHRWTRRPRGSCFRTSTPGSSSRCCAGRGIRTATSWRPRSWRR